MSHAQVQLDRSGLSGVRIDTRRAERSRPGWANTVERVVRQRRGTTRSRYVGPRWGDEGPEVTESHTLVDGVPLPVDGPVSDTEVAALRAAGYDADLVAQLPVDGPWSVAELVTVCQAGLAEVVDLTRQLPVDGPLSPGLVAELVEDGLPDVVRRISLADLDGPVDPDDLLPRFGSESV